MYTASGTLDRDQLAKHYAPLVKRIAYHLMAKLPASVQVEDIIQNGMLGLLDAMSRYEEGLGAQFETYAVQRIRGAMLDELRDGDWLSRGSRKSQKQIEQAVRALEQKLGRAPAESEIAEALEMPLADYQSLLGRVRGTQLVYLEDMGGGTDAEGESGFLDRHLADADADPMSLLKDQRLRQALVGAIDSLPERERHIMGMYSEQDMSLKEIAAVLGVTESRVSQLHSQSIARLRAKMRSH